MRGTQSIRVRVPATSANLGPGFDTLALALDLWNETLFTPGGEGYTATIEGEGRGLLPEDSQNLIFQALAAFYKQTGNPLPSGLSIHCQNRIPLGSGLGSSAAAVVTGLAGANALLGWPASAETLIRMAAEIEGHVDNAAAAALGGLVAAAGAQDGWITQRYDLPAWKIAVVLPDFALSTHAARAALPESVSMADAVFNASRVGLVIEALRSGNLELLRSAMEDRLHQPYRLPLIPGADAALQAAVERGAAVALSGAGPSVIAFGNRGMKAVSRAMQAAFERVGLRSRSWTPGVSNLGVVYQEI